MPAEPSSVEALVLRRAREGSVLPRLQAGASPQRLLTTLLGEHWLDASAALPMSALISLLGEFGITETSARASVLRAAEAGGCSPLTAWDLAEVAGAYRAFVTEHQELAGRSAAGEVSPSSALAARVEIFEAWRSFPGLDPDLPAELLPDDWPRAAARAIFAQLYDGLGPLAELRFRQIVGQHDEELASLATHHTTTGWAAAPDAG